MGHRYRVAWVFEDRPAKDFNALYEVADEIRYLTPGTKVGTDNDMVDLAGNMQLRLQQFEPALDLLVPAGRIAVAFLVGFLAGSSHSDISLAIYDGTKVDNLGRKVPNYQFYRCIKAEGGSTLVIKGSPMPEVAS